MIKNPPGPSIRVIDLETTGLPPDAEVVEAACVNVFRQDNGSISLFEPGHSLVKPSRTIPAEASSIHHITDEDVASCPPWDEIRKSMICPAPLAYCAHCADFEMHFMGSLDAPWIDTHKLACRLWPDAPNLKNQTLRYWLGLDLDIRRYVEAIESIHPSLMAPHRAAGDAIITAHILVRAFAQMTAKEMVRVSREPALLPKLTFGRYATKRFTDPDVPADYLRWILDNIADNRDVLYTAARELERRSILEDE